MPSVPAYFELHLLDGFKAVLQGQVVHLRPIHRPVPGLAASSSPSCPAPHAPCPRPHRLLGGALLLRRLHRHTTATHPSDGKRVIGSPGPSPPRPLPCPRNCSCSSTAPHNGFVLPCFAVIPRLSKALPLLPMARPTGQLVGRLAQRPAKPGPRLRLMTPFPPLRTHGPLLQLLLRRRGLVRSVLRGEVTAVALVFVLCRIAVVAVRGIVFIVVVLGEVDSFYR